MGTPTYLIGLKVKEEGWALAKRVYKEASAAIERRVVSEASLRGELTHLPLYTHTV